MSGLDVESPFPRRVSVALLAAAVVTAVLLSLTSCHGNDPLFCCSTPESCERNGGSGRVTPCTDPERPYCDDEGYFTELGRTCVPDPGGDVCGSADDCSGGGACVGHICVECESDAECGAERPNCNEATNTCEGCTSDEDCGTEDAPYCLVDDQRCVACVGEGDCGGDTPFCLSNHCVQCAGPEQCGGDTPICQANECVECDGADDCSAAEPVCGDDNACRGCVADGECASDVCDEDAGACFDEADVIYVARGGAAGMCTRAAPCGSFAQAIGQVRGTRNVIKAAPGTYAGPLVLDGIAVTILADGARVEVAAENQPVVSVSNGADVTIEGMTIAGANGPNEPPGLRCTDAPSTIRLRRSTVVDNDDGGGVSISGCQFSLVSNVIASNGSDESPFGGVQIANVAADGLREFAFNTVTRNVARPNAVAGVDCASVAGLTFSNNVVHQNLTTGSGTQVDDDDGCLWTYSDIGPETVAGTGNISDDPLFVDADNRDFHLQPTSPARDAGDPAAAATSSRDVDGDTRPAGRAPDMGADEVAE
jgi:hypothetical protein